MTFITKSVTRRRPHHGLFVQKSPVHARRTVPCTHGGSVRVLLPAPAARPPLAHPGAASTDPSVAVFSPSWARACLLQPPRRFLIFSVASASGGGRAPNILRTTRAHTARRIRLQDAQRNAESGKATSKVRRLLRARHRPPLNTRLTSALFARGRRMRDISTFFGSKPANSRSTTPATAQPTSSPPQLETVALVGSADFPATEPVAEQSAVPSEGTATTTAAIPSAPSPTRATYSKEEPSTATTPTVVALPAAERAGVESPPPIAPVTEPTELAIAPMAAPTAYAVIPVVVSETKPTQPLMPTSEPSATPTVATTAESTIGPEAEPASLDKPHSQPMAALAQSTTEQDGASSELSSSVEPSTMQPALVAGKTRVDRLETETASPPPLPDAASAASDVAKADVTTHAAAKGARLSSIGGTQSSAAASAAPGLAGDEGETVKCEIKAPQDGPELPAGATGVTGATQPERDGTSSKLAAHRTSLETLLSECGRVAEDELDWRHSLAQALPSSADTGPTEGSADTFPEVLVPFLARLVQGRCDFLLDTACAASL